MLAVIAYRKSQIIEVKASSSERPQFFGDAIYDAVQTAIAKLTDHHGPYALILDPARYGDATTQLVTAALTSTRDRIDKQLERGIHKTAALPSNRGLLISLGGMPVSRHVYRPAGRTDADPDVLVSYLPGEDRGTHRAFRVFQRSQLVVHNPGAIVRFDFVLNNDH
jgi:Encapsulating protein for peroxidase